MEKDEPLERGPSMASHDNSEYSLMFIFQSMTMNYTVPFMGLSVGASGFFAHYRARPRNTLCGFTGETLRHE